MCCVMLCCAAVCMGAPDHSLVDTAKGVWATNCADHTLVGDVCHAIVSSLYGPHTHCMSPMPRQNHARWIVSAALHCGGMRSFANNAMLKSIQQSIMLFPKPPSHKAHR